MAEVSVTDGISFLHLGAFCNFRGLRKYKRYYRLYHAWAWFSMLLSSKVILLAKIWRHEFKLANRIPLIPVLTALACLFLAAFVFELATVHSDYFIPARVLSGLGAICFTLFSIVSILESGTSGKG